MEFKIIVESLLTASQFELTVSENYKILMLKSSIQKILGIPVSQQHLLHQQAELSDNLILKDIPIYEGIRLKLIPSMKVGPIQSARRVLPSLSDYDSWFDINDVMQNSKRDEPLTLKTKYLVYKGCKKNIHRWKLNGDKSKLTTSSSSSGKFARSSSSHFGSGSSSREDEKIKRITDQTIQENIRTTEKLNQLRLKMELSNRRKKLKSIDLPFKNRTKSIEMHEKRAEIQFDDKSIQKKLETERTGPLEIKDDLSCNRSFKGNLSPSSLAASSLPFFSSELTPLECCFAGSAGSVVGSSNAPIIREYVGRICKEDRIRKTSRKESKSMQELETHGLLLDDFVTNPVTSVTTTDSDYRNLTSSATYKPFKDCQEKKIAGLKTESEEEINEYFTQYKLSEEEDSPSALEASLLAEEKSSKQPSAESLIEYYDNLTSSSTSSLLSNQFYHSDLDLNQLTAHLKNKLSISNQDINTSEGNIVAESKLLIEVNYDKLFNDLLDYGAKGGSVKIKDEEEDTATNIRYTERGSELADLFNSDSSNMQGEKSSVRRIQPLKMMPEKLKSFGSNPTLASTASNLTATTTASTSNVHIPQISRLDTIPNKYRRGYFNLNDACLSNTDLSSTLKIPLPLSERKPIINELSSFHHGSSVFHYRSHHQRNIEISEINPPDRVDSGSSGRQSRFEYCNSYYSNLNQYPPPTHQNKSTRATSVIQSFDEPEETSNFDFQSEENLFNMNFDSFYEDFSASELCVSPTTSSASSSTSFDSSSVSNIYDKKYVVLPEIKLEPDADKTNSEKTLLVATKEDVEERQQERVEASSMLRCFQCNKKVGLVMKFRCYCEKYFCSAHRYKETHNCSYNYRDEGKKKLERENPLCVSQKLPKI